MVRCAGLVEPSDWKGKSLLGLLKDLGIGHGGDLPQLGPVVAAEACAKPSFQAG